MTEPSLREVLRARRRLDGVVRRTPLVESPWLSALTGAPVHFKLECWQRTLSFKIRGAYNAVAALGERATRCGVIAASAGNHGQGIALAGATLGARATVFVPDGAPAAKKARIRELGATLHEVGGGYDEAEAAARDAAHGSGACFVHPYLDPAVVAGQGTVALEILDQLPELGTVLVPVGGGGLISGVGAVVKRVAGADTRVVGVQTELTRAMHDALHGHSHGDVAPTQSTLADGLAGGVDPRGVARVRAIADDVVLVTEQAVAGAIAALFEHHGLVVEGAGAVGVAALVSGVIEAVGPTAIVLSGGNIDGARLAPLISWTEWRH
ncbi:MAG: threonine ammonia-lyase [Longimicrobiales bacterium]